MDGGMSIASSRMTGMLAFGEEFLEGRVLVWRVTAGEARSRGMRSVEVVGCRL
jgi:hypothetical protein